MLRKNAIDLIFEDSETHEPEHLKANDIDVCHGTFNNPQVQKMKHS